MIRTEKHYIKIPAKESLSSVTAQIRALGYSIKLIETNSDIYTYFDTEAGSICNSEFLLRNKQNTGWQIVKDNDIFAEAVDHKHILSSPYLKNHIKPDQDTISPVIKIMIEQKEFALSRNLESVVFLIYQTCSYSRTDSEKWIKGSTVIFYNNAENKEEKENLFAVLNNLAGWKHSTFSPFAEGLKKLKISLPGSAPSDEFILTPQHKIISAANQILKKQACKMLANTDGTIRQYDIEYLHDLRVATRRARFALKLFKSFFNEEYCDSLRREIGWIGASLGSVRDLDVFIQSLEAGFTDIKISNEIRIRILKYIEQKRNLLFAKLKEDLSSCRYQEILSRMKNFQSEKNIISSEYKKSIPLVKEAASFLIEKMVERINRIIEKKGGKISAAKLHRIRIAFKGLRYTCEFFSDVFEESIREIIQSFVEIQDCLGTHQDAVMAIKNVSELAAERYESDDADINEILNYGQLIAINRSKMKNQRKKFKKLLNKIPFIFDSLAKL